MNGSKIESFALKMNLNLFENKNEKFHFNIFIIF